MASLQELNALYVNYENTINEVGRATSALSRMLNAGITPRNHPCSQEFYQAVERWVADFLAGEPPYQELLEAARMILDAAAQTTPQASDAYWFLLAAQAHAKPILPLITAEDRAALYDSFTALYPKRHRMPLQNEICRLLSK